MASRITPLPTERITNEYELIHFLRAWVNHPNTSGNLTIEHRSYGGYEQWIDEECRKGTPLFNALAKRGVFAVSYDIRDENDTGFLHLSYSKPLYHLIATYGYTPEMFRQMEEEDRIARIKQLEEVKRNRS